MTEGQRPFFRGWKLLLFVYIVLIAGSWLFPRFQTLVQSPVNYRLAEISLNGEKYSYPYFSYSGSETDSLLPVIIQAGFDNNPEELKVLAESLAVTRTVYLLPYNGQIATDRSIDSFSLQTQANILLQFIRSQNLQYVHLIGQGFGFPATMKAALAEEDMIYSVSSFNGRGIQEMELLGGYQLNHAIYAAQKGGIWLARNLIPDFGLMEPLLMSDAKTQSYFDLDLSESREEATMLRQPTLIIHDERSGYKKRIAEEQYRIIPQSILITDDKGISDYAVQILGFLENVESERDTYARDNASSERIEAAAKTYEPGDDLLLRGNSLIIIMILLVLATLVSEDLTCIGAGLMVARGIIGHVPAILACLIGIFLGDILIYLLGRWLGRSAIRKRPFKWFIDEQDLDRSYQWFELKGPVIIIASRFVPGSRFPTYFTAGAIGASFFMFIIYFGISSIIWTPILVELAVLVGNEMISYFEIYQEYAIWVLLGVLFVFMVIFKLIIPSFTYRGRRLLYSRYKRIINWEFWPVWIIYTPVVFYILYLAIRYRSLTLFTAANPGIEDGGFKGESKSEILSKLNSDDVAPFRLVDENLSMEAKYDAVHQFMDDLGLTFPVVIKPDVGERGKGVHIVKDELMLEKAFRYAKGNLLVQEYIEGKEFGVFYYRMPGMKNGEIYSITEKSMQTLVGDGKHNLEHLILSDERAVCLAEHHINEHADHIFDRPEDGEVVELVKLGTHARGAIFYDGMRYKTEAMRKRMDEIAGSFDGFMFGRFDIRSREVDSFMKGEDYTVLELNGVTSEATHIYNPGYSLKNAWSVLFRQWELAFEIGKRNTEMGAETTPFSQLMRRVFA
jgi:membrane protein DedA with SNARE-associated domain